MFTYNNIRKNRFGLIFFSILLFLAVIFIKQKQNENELLLQRYEKARNTVPPQIYDDMNSLKEKLLNLEFENKLRTQDLLNLRHRLKEKFADNLTEGISLSLPSIYNSLPHLLAHKDALSPSVHVTRHRKSVSLAFGVPTVRREHPYLYQMLHSMISGLNEEEKNDVIIIVYIGEVNEEYTQDIVNAITKKFKKYINSGLIEIISASRNYYPNLDNLPSTFNDDSERVKWRAKQNLDYAFLMMYAQSRGIFYVQLEDDIVATPGYATTIKAFAMQQSTNNWFMLEFSSLGFIGKTFHAHHLNMLIEFLIIFYKDKPNDWLLDHVMWVKVCHPEGDNKACDREKAKIHIRFKPSLFQHVGKVSSLKGKQQNLVDKEFKKDLLFQAHLNPKAIIKTDFEEYQTFTAVRGYLGHSFLWFLTPKKNQVMRIIFITPMKLSKYLFRTGNSEHPGDILINGTIEALLQSKKDAIENINITNDGDISSPYRNEDYVYIGGFDDMGLAAGSVDPNIDRIAEIRIRVEADLVENWVIFSEFFIETVK